MTLPYREFANMSVGAIHESPATIPQGPKK